MAVDSRVWIAFCFLAMGCEPRSIVFVRSDAGETTESNVRISAGLDHTCFVRAGTLSCAGDNSSFELGRTGGNAPSPIPAETQLADFVDLAVGGSYTCALRESGELLCLGSNDTGQLGTVGASEGPSPIPVPLPGPVASVSAQGGHVCAILRDASLYCWGQNLEGEIGQGDEFPGGILGVTQVAPGIGFARVSAGQGHTCAVAVDGQLYCWGSNFVGELGVGAPTGGQVRTPRALAGRWRDVACGQKTTCAIADDGALYCWGEDDMGDGHASSVGVLGTGIHTTPIRVGTGNDWTAVDVEFLHACGIRAGGALYCWGRNAEGQLGAGSSEVVEEPRQVGERIDFEQVAVGRMHSCARTRDGSIWCTGENARGALGVGDFEQRSSFTAIDELP